MAESKLIILKEKPSISFTSFTSTIFLNFKPDNEAIYPALSLASSINFFTNFLSNSVFLQETRVKKLLIIEF